MGDDDAALMKHGERLFGLPHFCEKPPDVNMTCHRISVPAGIAKVGLDQPVSDGEIEAASAQSSADIDLDEGRRDAARAGFERSRDIRQALATEYPYAKKERF